MKKKDGYEMWLASSMSAIVVADPTRTINPGGGSSEFFSGGHQNNPGHSSRSSRSSYSSRSSMRSARFNATSFSVGVAVGAIF
jgi:hypothetical protein